LQKNFFNQGLIKINTMGTTEKLVIISTTGPDNIEKATLPFVVATAAQTLDAQVVIILQASAVLLAKKGMAENVNAQGFMPLKKLMDTFIEFGGKLFICSPCIKERAILPEDLIEGSQIVAAGTVAEEVLSATSTLTY
jgi:predicted peroxiredoxin